MDTKVTAAQLLDEVKHMRDESVLQIKSLCAEIEDGIAAGEDVSDLQIALQMYRDRKFVVGQVYVRLMEVAQGNSPDSTKKRVTFPE